MSDEAGASTAAWRRRVDAEMMKWFGIDLVDVGLSDDEVERYAASFEEPLEFVRWFGEKHDLQTLDEMGVFPRSSWTTIRVL